MFVEQMDLTVALHSTFLGGDGQPRQGLSERQKQQASKQAAGGLPCALHGAAGSCCANTEHPAQCPPCYLAAPGTGPPLHCT